MEITLHLVEDGKKITAHAVVTPLATRVEGKKVLVVKTNVGFFLDGKFVKPVTTDEGGLASLELGELKIGVHTVTVTVLGVSPVVSATEDIEIEPKEKKATSLFGRIMMALFWAIMILVSYGIDTLPLMLAYLILTLPCILGYAKLKGETFKKRLGNNNWVFPAVVVMFLASLLGSFFAEEWMWSDMTLLCALALVPATFVSFWDESLVVLKKALEVGSKGGLAGALKFLARDGLAEIFWGVFKK